MNASYLTLTFIAGLFYANVVMVEDATYLWESQNYNADAGTGTIAQTANLDVANANTSPIHTSDFGAVESEPPSVEPAGLYDIDGNGQIEALNDGLLIVKYFFGIRGEPLISGAIGDNATRNTAAQIEAYFQSVLVMP